MPATAAASDTAYATPLPQEAVEQIAAQLGQKPRYFELAPEDWVGADDLRKFLRLSDQIRNTRPETDLVFGQTAR